MIITRGARPLLGDKDILFIKNHGVMVRAPNIAEAWHDLHYLERAAEVQLKTIGSGCKLLPVLPAVAADAARQMREGDPKSARMHLESIRRVLDRQAPDYRD
ncbi:ribulose-5-phosphate 4-epimerase/fuculose-1-phosphate aldolase [Agrobacterium tumefaciens]|nr:ribulose-5-phosphate 4-epimerase/fuculose-1-phosphate aldolase [Agrobacterium tumefaciens]